MFYRIVHRAISCGKFFCFRCHPFKRFHATLPKLQHSFIFHGVAQRKEKHLIGGRAESNQDGKSRLREGCDKRSREGFRISADKKSEDCVMGGYFRALKISVNMY